MINIRGNEYLTGKIDCAIDENDILHFAINGAIDVGSVIEAIKILNIARAKVPGGIYAFVDFNNIKSITKEARLMCREQMMSEDIRKVAFYGQHPVAKVLAKFIIGSSFGKIARFFNSKKESYGWLISDLKS